jgi:hypothetical protein
MLRNPPSCLQLAALVLDIYIYYLQLAALVVMTHCQLGTHTNSSYYSLRLSSIYTTCNTFNLVSNIYYLTARFARPVYILYYFQLAALVVYDLLLHRYTHQKYL